MLLTEEVEIIADIRTYDYYSKKGYVIETYADNKGKTCIKKNTIIRVNIKDLKPHNPTKIKLRCDYCGEEFNRKFCNYLKYKNKFSTINKDACDKCRYEKTKESNLLMYGVENSFQREDVKNNIVDINILKHGVDNFKRLSYEHVYKYIKNLGGILLTTKEEYTTTRQNLKLKCIDCDEEFETSWGTILKTNKIKCNKCSYIDRSGENNSNWNGGTTIKGQKIRHSIEYKRWREFIFERDNYTCQCCGDNTGGNLEAHHINNFSNNEELRFDIDNGITLCNRCHNPNQEGSFHNLYGTFNNNKDQLEEYINKLKLNK